ncbi:MAG: hypothetical protein JWR81_3602, partial [Pseudonocardia sp.]|nr:hypothetical protein [Pseudonocardia sp.]
RRPRVAARLPGVPHGRLTARPVSTLLAAAGFAVPRPVGLECADGREARVAHGEVGWW